MSEKKKLPKPPTRLPLRGGPPVIYLRKLRFEKQRPDSRGDYPVYRCGELENLVLILRVFPLNRQTVEATKCVVTPLVHTADRPYPLDRCGKSQNPDTAVRSVLDNVRGFIESRVAMNRDAIAGAQKRLETFERMRIALVPYLPKSRAG